MSIQIPEGLNEEATFVLEHTSKVLAEPETNFAPHYSKGFSERCLETPWLASHFRGGEKLLDVGFTMSSLDILGLLLALRREHEVDIQAYDIVRPERVIGRYPEEWRKEILEVPVEIGDFCEAQVAENTYDICSCISTLEHIGFMAPSGPENQDSAFELPKRPEDVVMERDPEIDQRVISQFRKALKPGGHALISVPMGKGGSTLLQDSLGYFCAQWEFEERSWQSLLESPGFKAVKTQYFGLDSEGSWVRVDGPKDLTEKSSRLKRHAEGVAMVSLQKL